MSHLTTEFGAILGGSSQPFPTCACVYLGVPRKPIDHNPYEVQYMLPIKSSLRYVPTCHNVVSYI
jgi:hypothetical protein